MSSGAKDLFKAVVQEKALLFQKIRVLKKTPIKTLKSVVQGWHETVETPDGKLPLNECLERHGDWFGPEKDVLKAKLSEVEARLAFMERAKLFAQIQNDSLLSGTYELEGNQFTQCIRILERLGQGISPEVQPILERMQAIASIDEKIQQCSREELNAIAAELSDKILALKEGEWISMPGGWTNFYSSSHAMTYQFKRVVREGVDCLELYIVNTEDGSEYHEQLSSHHKEHHNAVFAYRGPLLTAGEKADLEEYLQGLLLLKSPGLRTAQEQEIDGKHVYQHVLPRAHFLGFQQVSAMSLFPSATIQSQLSGTCVQRSIEESIKPSFSKLEAYEHFRDVFKRRDLDDFILCAKANHAMGEPWVRTQISEAIRAMLRRLHERKDLSEEEKVKEQEALITYQTELSETPILEEENSSSSAVAFRKPSTIMWVSRPYKPLEIRPVTEDAHVIEPILESYQPMLRGGPGLLRQMDELIQHAERLFDSGDYALLAKRLMLELTSLPLPSSLETFTDRMPFYEGITAENQLECYRALTKIQNLYARTMQTFVGKDVLPEMVVSCVSASFVCLYLQNQFATTPNPNTFREHIFRAMDKLFDNRLDSFMTSGSPHLDSRLRHLKSLHQYPAIGPRSVKERFKHLLSKDEQFRRMLNLPDPFFPPIPPNYYQTLLSNEPALDALLTKRFYETDDENTCNPELKKQIISNKAESYYYLVEHLETLREEAEFQPFLRQLELCCQVTTCLYSALRPICFRDSPEQEERLRFLVNRAHDDIRPYSLLDSLTRDLKFDPRDMKRYPLENASPVSLVLLTERENDNLIQLSQDAPPFLYHLRASKPHQVLLTLEYFSEHVHLLNNKDLMVYLEANLFEPGLLQDAILKHPELLKKFKRLLDKGIVAFLEKEPLLEPGLDLLRLACMFYRYVQEFQPTHVEAPQGLQALGQRLQNILQKEHLPVEFQQSLHLTYGMTLLAQLHRHEEVNEMMRVSLLQNILPSYIQCLAMPMGDLPQSQKMALLRMNDDIKQVIRALPKDVLTSIVDRTLVELGLRDYTIDFERGVVTNNPAFARVTTPLFLVNHPLLKLYGPANLNYCLESSDRNILLFGEPHQTLRLCRTSSKHKYRLQKSWTVDGQTRWYELSCNHSTLRSQWNLSAEPFRLQSKCFDARETHIWVTENEVLVTEHGIPSFAGGPITGATTSAELSLHQINGGAALCSDNTWLHQLFSGFEHPSFMTVCKRNDDCYELQFSRYGFGIVANKRVGGWEYALLSDPSFIVELPIESFTKGVGGFIVSNGKTRKAYVPLQPFIRREQEVLTSEFHHLVQDLEGAIPESLVQNRQDLMPWEYANTESVLQISMGEEGPEPKTLEEALALSYFYLGSHQPDKAFEILEHCSQRFRPMHWDNKALSLLHWIIKALPYQLTNIDKKAELASPAYVACQLKALALYTSSFNPLDKTTYDIPNFEKNTREGIRAFAEWGALMEFEKELNTPLFELYNRYQKMREDMPAAFQLQDREKQSLLDYYHFHLPSPKALGSLGYEWQVLRLKRLKREYDAIKAIARAKGRLSRGQQIRLDEIGAFLSEDSTIRSRSTRIERVRLNLDIGAKPQLSKPLRKVHNEEVLTEAMRALKQDIKGLDFYAHLEAFYTIMCRSPSDPLRSKLIDFCTHLLMARHHVPLLDQSDLTALYCSILLRIANHPEIFSKDVSDPLDEACRLPPPEIWMYQAKDTTESLILGSPSEIWLELSETATPPLRGSSCAELNAYSLSHIFSALHWDDSKVALAKRYEEAAHRLGSAPKEGEEDEGILSRARDFQHEALKTMKDLASQLLGAPDAQQSLLETTEDLLERITLGIQHRQEDLLAFANRGPSDPGHQRQRQLEIAGGSRAPLDLNRLIALYFKGDKMAYVLETALSDADIELLHEKIGHFIAFSVRKQGLERFQTKMNEAKGSPDPALLQQAAYELIMADEVNYETDAAMAVMQYRYEVLLRPHQITAILRMVEQTDSEHTFVETIQKIIPGGGKTSVILPELAYLKAHRTNLVVKEVPKALFATQSIDLSQRSQTLYQQTVHAFEFSRDSDCSPKYLEWLYQHWNLIISNQDYVVTVGESLQSLELKYVELVVQGPRGDPQTWDQQIDALDKLLTLMKTRMDLTIDEVHQGLALEHELNYTLGEKEPIDEEILQECLYLYEFFEHVSFDGKSFRELLKNPNLITDDNLWSAAFVELISQVVMSHKSPLHEKIESWDDEQRRALVDYFQNKGDKIPDNVAHASREDQEIFALYKAQLSEFLPHTLRRKLNVHYGASHQQSDSGLAIPYIANNVPNEGCRFGAYIEEINLSIQMMLIDGIPDNNLKRYLESLKTKAERERMQSPSINSLDETPTGQWLLSLGCSFNEGFDALAQKLRHHNIMISQVLRNDVLQSMALEPYTLSSNAYNHVELSHSCQGVSGTPSNSSTFHDRLSFDPKTQAATEAFLVSVLKDKAISLRVLPDGDLAATIQALFSGKTKDECVRSIMDVCATFAGKDNETVARAIAEYLNKHPSQLSDPPLKVVLFYNQLNELCALNVAEGSIKTIGGSDADVINQALPDSTPSERFIYYDQSHTLGADLKQAPLAKGLVLVNHTTDLQSFVQGASRLRGLQDSQSLDIMIPPAMASLDFEKLIQHMEKKEETALQNKQFPATLKKLNNLMRAEVLARLRAIPKEESLKKHELATKCHHFLVRQNTRNLFETHGQILRDEPTHTLLEAHRSRLLAEWQRVFPEESSETLRDRMDEIIKKALPKCKPTERNALGPIKGMSVSVQTEMQVAHQLQVEQKKERRNQYSAPYKPWSLDKPPIRTLMVRRFMQPNIFLSLSDICQRSQRDLRFSFGNIHCSENFYRTTDDQTKFLGPNQKTVYGLLFLKKKDGQLECLLLSQRELKEHSKWLEKHPDANVWISTTQHGILAGSPPAGVLESPEYQLMIEQIRFFKGEFSLLLENKASIQWLLQDTDGKLKFFEETMMPKPCNDFEGLAQLREYLHSKQKVRLMKSTLSHARLDERSIEVHLRDNKK